jgi:uncharacterized protein GlcG (DUF336 family)
MLRKYLLPALLLLPVSATASTPPKSAECAALPSYSQLKAALVKARQQPNGGFDLDMWGTVVNRDGTICAVTFTGEERGSQWPGSRIISAQKAYTANAFSLPTLALSTANLFTATQPGGSLYGLQHSNPINPEAAYHGKPEAFGQPKDPLVGRRIGGVNVFGGGLPLYNAQRQLVGAIGVSGDSSCADHNIAWRTRHLLELDYVPGGVAPSPERADNIVYDLGASKPAGWGHPECNDKVAAIASELPVTRK